MHAFRRVVILVALAALCRVDSSKAGQPPAVEVYLIAGNLAPGEAALRQRLAAQPQDHQARFGLGTLQFVRAIERLAQNLHRYGLRDVGQQLPVPILRVPIPENPEPQVLSYAESRKILQTLLDDLARVCATLDGVQSADVKLPLHFGRIRLDLNGDGRADEEETLWRLYARLNRAAPVDQRTAEEFVIAFDKADVHWLCGYCHLLSAIGEFALAYDASELFDRTAHLFFMRAASPYEFLVHGKKVFNVGDVDVVDFIAFIHLLNFPVREPNRAKAALEHLEAVIAHSRLSWKAILAETDDDREWIPNPKQAGVIPGVQITPQMVTAWTEFLSEAEAILQGKKLIPFWRARDPRGVNLRRVFTEPRPFDLVLWIQGTAAAPYLEEGPLSTPDAWSRWQQIFRGQFIGFAIWFN